MDCQPSQMVMRHWGRSFAKQAPEVAVPVIVLGEYRYGIQQSRDRQHYEQWLTETIRYYRVLDVDEETAISYATIRTDSRERGLQFLPTTFGLPRFAVSILSLS